MAKDMKKHLTQKNIKIVNKHMSNCSSFAIRKNQIKITI